MRISVSGWQTRGADAECSAAAIVAARRRGGGSVERRALVAPPFRVAPASVYVNCGIERQGSGVCAIRGAAANVEFGA
jgi:hypothetical protein